MNSDRVGFGGGCHWCTEAVFASLRGVAKVEQGFISSTAPNDSYSEAVLVTFDPGDISQDVLVEIHLRTHASTSNHWLRPKYRSAVYVFAPNQDTRARKALERLQADFSETLVTRVLPIVDFRPSDKRYQEYYLKNAASAFCRRYIDPKLDTLRSEYANLCRE